MTEIQISVIGQENLVVLTGKCLSSELYWSKPVEIRNHLSNGLYSTAYVWKENYNEVWQFEGLPGEYRINKFLTGKTGTFENCGSKFSQGTAKVEYHDVEGDLYNYFESL